MLWRRLRGILDSSRGIDSDVEHELRFHIEEKIEGLVQEGRSEADARREVMESFAGTTRPWKRPVGPIHDNVWNDRGGR